MINRYTLAAIAAAVALSGCAKHSVDETVADFSSGATQLSVTHLPARTADGATVFVTVDGSEAGALPVGESMSLRVPAGAHQVGGYARSLIGRVTIPSVKITTTPDSTRYVAYTVTKSKPLFTELSEDPNPKPQSAPAAEPVETVKASATVTPSEPAPTAEKSEPAQTSDTVQKPEIAQVTEAAQPAETATAAETAQATEAAAAAETAPAAEPAQATETTQTTATSESSASSQPPETAKTSEQASAAETPQS